MKKNIQQSLNVSTLISTTIINACQKILERDLKKEEMQYYDNKPPKVIVKVNDLMEQEKKVFSILDNIIELIKIESSLPQKEFHLDHNHLCDNVFLVLSTNEDYGTEYFPQPFYGPSKDLLFSLKKEKFEKIMTEIDQILVQSLISYNLQTKRLEINSIYPVTTNLWHRSPHINNYTSNTSHTRAFYVGSITKRSKRMKRAVP